MILLNVDFTSKDIEQSLWKTVFYKVIEDYRSRIRKVCSTDYRNELFYFVIDFIIFILVIVTSIYDSMLA